jgi:long-subunit fatty acid transport protein
MVGLMLEPLEGTRFGVTYTSPVKLDFKDRPSTNNLGPVFQLLKDNRGLFTRRTSGSRCRRRSCSAATTSSPTVLRSWAT